MHFYAKLHLGLSLLVALALAGCGGQAGQSTPTSQPKTTTAQLSVASSGAGVITSNPAGINCGSTCTASFNSGTTVTLTAAPNAGNSFAGWSGACSGSSTTCTVVLTGTISVSAGFNAVAAVQLTVTETGSGTGTVTSNPAGINCGQTCTATFTPGTTVALTATANPGFVFDGWSGTCSGTAACTVPMKSIATVTATFSASLQAIKHIIFMAQENRGFLHYFGALPKYWADSNGQYAVVPFDGLPQFKTPPGPAPTAPGCDPTSPSPGVCKLDPANPIQSFRMTNMCVENIIPFWDESHIDFNFKDPTSDKATLDGFIFNAATYARNLNFSDVNGIRVMGYYTGDDLNYYYFMASNFGTSDRWFSPVMTRTEPNRLFLLAATSAGHVHSLPPNSPSLNNMTIFEALQKAGISWKVYVTDPNPTPLQGSVMAAFSFSYMYSQNFAPIAQYQTDLDSGNLPQVAMIEPGYNDGTDEHPFENPPTPAGSSQLGAQTVSKYINGLMKSTSWKDSVFILTWDEFGGFYDDFPPQLAVSPDNIKPVDINSGNVCGYSTGPNCDFTFTGFRVPFIVVSPFAKKHYVSHTVADHTAILKFIETRFNLSNLTERDKAQFDMTEFFDFADAPWSTPPLPPAQKMNGVCRNLP